MDGSRNHVGFFLLPSELIQDILLRLVLPEISRMKLVSKTITSLIYCHEFLAEFNVRSSSDTWLFVYQKRSLRDSVLYAFTCRSNRWFKIPVSRYLFPVVPPGEDLYFLAASGGFFLFASNNCRELIVVNLASNAVTKIPPSPLGPRGTSSWRRSGLKLIAGPPGSNRFRFLFAELYDNQPVLFEYSSEVGTWRSYETHENEGRHRHEGAVYLSVVHRRSDSVVLVSQPNEVTPVILRPRLGDTTAMEERLAVGFSTSTGTGNALSRLHVYGDSFIAIVKSQEVDDRRKVRVFTCIELWGLGADGRRWELISKVPDCLVDKVRKPYWVMMGCLEERDGVVRVVLVTNCEGIWDLIWLCYDLGCKQWSWVPLPEFRMKGLNMAGITLASGLHI